MWTRTGSNRPSFESGLRENFKASSQPKLARGKDSQKALREDGEMASRRLWRLIGSFILIAASGQHPLPQRRLSSSALWSSRFLERQSAWGCDRSKVKD